MQAGVYAVRHRGWNVLIRYDARSATITGGGKTSILYVGNESNLLNLTPLIGQRGKEPISPIVFDCQLRFTMVVYASKPLDTPHTWFPAEPNIERLGHTQGRCKVEGDMVYWRVGGCCRCVCGEIWQRGKMEYEFFALEEGNLLALDLVGPLRKTTKELAPARLLCSPRRQLDLRLGAKFSAGISCIPSTLRTWHLHSPIGWTHNILALINKWFDELAVVRQRGRVIQAGDPCCDPEQNICCQ